MGAVRDRGIEVGGVTFSREAWQSGSLADAVEGLCDQVHSVQNTVVFPRSHRLHEVERSHPVLVRDGLAECVSSNKSLNICQAALTAVD